MESARARFASFKDSKVFPYLMDASLFLLAFFATFLAYILIFRSLGFYPFNEDGLTTMMLDQRDQYVAYMRAYQNALQNGGSLVYTLGKVFGGDFQSLFTYYLSSPFNLFLVFCQSKDIPAFFFYTSIIKMSFGAGNVYLLARFASGKRRLGYLAFAFAYGLCSYAIVYLSNFMYLDGLMILPLVTLGLEALKKGKALWVYPLALSYALITNWYLGAMICVYCVLVFLGEFSFMKGGLKARLPYLLRFFLFSLAGGLLSAFVWVSAFLHFDGTKATLTLPKSTFFNWASFFEGLLENNYLSRSAISRNTGYMTMFVSVVSLAFAQLYFTNKGHSWREKSKDAFILTAYFFASLLSVLNALFHGGREPTFFPARYSFIIGFHLVYLSCKETSSLEETPLWGGLVPAGNAAILLPILCCYKTNALAKTGKEILYPLSIVSLILYSTALLLTSAYLLYRKRAKPNGLVIHPGFKYVLEGAILALAIVSSCRGANNVLSANIADDSYQSYSVYLQDDELTPVFDAVKEKDSSLYRMESTFNRPGYYNTINNNPLFYSYNGLSHYSSTEKKAVANYMRRIGFHRNGFWERYDAGSTEAMNAFLGVKYLIDSDDSSLEKPQFLYSDSPLNLFRKIDLGVSSYSYYQNDFALPLGFVTSALSSTYVSQGERREGKKDVYWYDHFEYQNKMYQAMNDGILDSNGKKKDIFHPIPIGSISLNSRVKEVAEDEYERKTYSFSYSGAITYTFTIPEEAENNTLYLFQKSETSNLTYTLDGETLGLMTYWNSGIHSFNAQKGTTHTLKVRYTGSTAELTAQIIPEIYYEDLPTLREYLSAIKEGGANDLKVSSTPFSTSYEGTFDLKKSGGEFLFTLPYESNFSIYVDGKKKEAMERFDIFTAVSLDGIEEGTHRIKVVYSDKGLILGGVISLLSLGGIAPLLVFYPKFEKKIFKKEDETAS